MDQNSSVKHNNKMKLNINIKSFKFGFKCGKAII